LKSASVIRKRSGYPVRRRRCPPKWDKTAVFAASCSAVVGGPRSLRKNSPLSPDSGGPTLPQPKTRSLYEISGLGCSDVQVPNKDTLKGGHQTGTDFRRKYIEQELLEVSAVGIPANPNALALGLKSGAIEKADLRALHDLIRQTLGDTKEEGNWEEVPIKVKRQTKKEKELAELLRLAREVRDILKG